MTPGLKPTMKPFWKTPGNIPFRQDPGLLTGEELDNLDYGGEVHTQRFDMSVPEDVRRYNEICQAMWENRYLKVRELVQERRETQDWVIFLQWAELYALPPKPHRSTQGVK